MKRAERIFLPFFRIFIFCFKRFFFRIRPRSKFVETLLASKMTSLNFCCLEELEKEMPFFIQMRNNSVEISDPPGPMQRSRLLHFISAKA